MRLAHIPCISTRAQIVNLSMHTNGRFIWSVLCTQSQQWSDMNEQSLPYHWKVEVRNSNLCLRLDEHISCTSRSINCALIALLQYYIDTLTLTLVTHWTTSKCFGFLSVTCSLHWHTGKYGPHAPQHTIHAAQHSQMHMCTTVLNYRLPNMTLKHEIDEEQYHVQWTIPCSLRSTQCFIECKSTIPWISSLVHRIYVQRFIELILCVIEISTCILVWIGWIVMPWMGWWCGCWKGATFPHGKLRISENV